MKTTITETSKQLFIDLAKDAGNWAGSPLLDGNVPSSAQLRGNLTQLKRMGYIATQRDDDDRKLTWIFFTEAGKAYAATLGIDLSWIQ